MNARFTDIIWDLDGTLIDSYPIMTRILQEVLKLHNIKTDSNDVYEAIKVSMGHAIQKFSGQDSQKNNLIRRQFIERERLEPGLSYHLFPDTLETLEKLEKSGVRNFVLTHRNASTYKIMKAKHMDVFIHDTITIDDGFKRKPSPEAFLHLMEKHGLNAKTTLNVGDRLFDIQAGHGAGLPGCLIHDQYNGFCLNQADYVVLSRLEVLNLIDGQVRKRKD